MIALTRSTSIRRRLGSGPPRRSSGQALVEFALILPLMMTIVLGVLNIMPAITTRGLVLDVSATAMERAGRFLPPNNGTAVDDRALLCNQLLDIVRVELSAQLGTAALSPLVMPAPGPGCTALTGGKLNPTPGTANPVVYVMGLDANGNAAPSVRLLPAYNAATQTLMPVRVQVCVSYNWHLSGLFKYFVPTQTFTYRFCGNTVIDPNRSR